MQDDELDLKQLAVRRGGASAPARIAPPRRIVTRYLLPAGLILGFAGVLAWAARDAWLPRQAVTIAPVLVSVADIQTAGTPLFKAAGWVEPRPTPVRVTALADGVVSELLVVEDQLVQQGEPVARMIARDAELALERSTAMHRNRQAEVDAAEAALEAARKNFEFPTALELTLEEAAAALAAVETDLSNLPFALERAQAQLRVAEIDLAGKQKARDGFSGIVIEQAQAAADAATATVDELTQRKSALEAQRAALSRRRDAAARRLELRTDEQREVAAAEAALEAATADVEDAAAACAEATLKLERMTITAPVMGRVLELMASPGMSLMSAGIATEGRESNTVVTMYQPERLQVRCDVRFEDLPRVGRGAPVEVRSPAVEEPLAGEVLFLTASANTQKNTLEVKVSLDNPPDVLKPEMLVDVTFLAAETESSGEVSEDELRLFVPRSLVTETESGATVWVADLEQGVARRVAIETGVSTPALIEVTEGITAATRLIVGGREQLSEGARIVVTGEDSSLGDE